MPPFGRLGVRGRRDILEGSHGPGPTTWVVVRAGQGIRHQPGPSASVHKHDATEGADRRGATDGAGVEAEEGREVMPGYRVSA